MLEAHARLKHKEEEEEEEDDDEAKKFPDEPFPYMVNWAKVLS